MTPSPDLVERLRARKLKHSVHLENHEFEALASELSSLRALLGTAQALLGELVDRDLSYHGENIVIPTGGHGNAIKLVRRARDFLASME